MKGFKKSTIKVEDLIEDDYFKVAGVLYRVHKIEPIGTARLIQFYNVRRPMITGHLTFNENTLMHIWNQK